MQHTCASGDQRETPGGEPTASGTTTPAAGQVCVVRMQVNKLTYVCRTQMADVMNNHNHEVVQRVNTCQLQRALVLPG